MIPPLDAGNSASEGLALSDANGVRQNHEGSADPVAPMNAESVANREVL
jgi:hypothetical protein